MIHWESTITAELRKRALIVSIFILIILTATVLFAGTVSGQDNGENYIFVGDNNNTVYAVDYTDQSIVWEKTGFNGSIYDIEYIGDEVSVFDSQGYIYFIDPGDGSINGEVHVGSPNTVNIFRPIDVMAHDGQYLYANNGSGVVRVDPQSKAVDDWFIDKNDPFSIVYHEAHDLLIVSYEGELDIRSYETDNPNAAYWTANVGGTSQEFGAPMLDTQGNHVYSGMLDNMVKVDASNGSIIWNSDPASSHYRSVRSAGNNYTYVVDSFGTSEFDDIIQVHSGNGSGYKAYRTDSDTPYNGDNVRSQIPLEGLNELLSAANNKIHIHELDNISNYKTSFEVGDNSITAFETVDDLESGPTTNSHLAIDSRSLVEPNDTIEYRVESNISGEWMDVTSSSTVQSGNSSILVVDQSNRTFEGIGIGEVNVTAEYNGMNTYKEITVAPLEVEYLDILPPVYRFSAVISDTSIMVIWIAIGFAAAATRAASAFAGLGAMELILIIGWFGDFVSLGIVLVGLFTAIFIGFNLAANIDYTVRR